MAKILFAWELGGGFGHLVKIRTLARDLAARGHQLYLAAKDLAAAVKVLRDVPLAGILAAPLCAKRMTGPPKPTECYPEILLQDGYGDVERLTAALRAWQSLIQLIQPAALIAEHAPAAMLAAQALQIPYALLGTGFTCPRIVQDRWPVFSKRTIRDHHFCATTLDAAWNQALGRCGWSELPSSTSVITGARAAILACLPELDPFGPRPHERYWGNWSIAEDGQPVEWPYGSGPRVFCYLKPRPEINLVIRLLGEQGWPAILYLGSEPPPQHPKWPANIRLCRQPVSMPQMCAQAQLMILNGTLGTTASALESGIPSWHVPIYLEQILIGQQIERLGAGLCAQGNLAASLHTMFHQGIHQLDRQRVNALTFANQQCWADLPTRVERCVTDLEIRFGF